MSKKGWEKVTHIGGTGGLVRRSFETVMMVDMKVSAKLRFVQGETVGGG